MELGKRNSKKRRRIAEKFYNNEKNNISKFPTENDDLPF